MILSKWACAVIGFQFATGAVILRNAPNNDSWALPESSGHHDRSLPSDSLAAFPGDRPGISNEKETQDETFHRKVRKDGSSVAYRPKCSVLNSVFVSNDRQSQQNFIQRRLSSPDGRNADEVAEWIAEQVTEKAEQPVQSRDGEANPNMAQVLPLTSTKELSIGVSGLEGCTAMFVVAKNAIYVAHYWESESSDLDLKDANGKTVIRFDPDYKGPNPRAKRNWVPVSAPAEVTDAAFQKRVLDALQNGVQSLDPTEKKSPTTPQRAAGDPVQYSFTQFVQTFDVSLTTMWVMTPKLAGMGDILYRDKIDQIKNLLNTILEANKEPVLNAYQEFPYLPADGRYEAQQEDVDNGFRGVCLFQFTPNDPKPSVKGRVTRTNERNLARIWIETSPAPAATVVWDKNA